ncbi:hypothetical protein HPB50_017901 [Hyalomma asiaticum]|uniref:Uncharacterized protein n=1 Tax=Hyalomma asiaticum TaxID=266040 RepID=A0ACB7T3G5_HYAAI|nr:hypothetical protein HPB50_017901 [Hyalomma asiaticum]
MKCLWYGEKPPGDRAQQKGYPPELELLFRLPQPPVPMFAQPVNNVCVAPGGTLPPQGMAKPVFTITFPASSPAAPGNLLPNIPGLSTGVICALCCVFVVLQCETAANDIVCSWYSIHELCLRDRLTAGLPASSISPAVSSHPSATFVPVTPGVPKASSGVGASGEWNSAMGNGGVFAGSMPLLVNHGCPVPTEQVSKHSTQPAGSGDFDDDFDDFKSAPERSQSQQPLPTLNNVPKVPADQAALIQAVPPNDTGKVNSLPDSPRLEPPKTSTLASTHNLQLSQKRNNICESPKMPKTFNFGLKINLNSLLSSNPLDSKPTPAPAPVSVPSTNSTSGLEQVSALDDDFADFQAAFPQASKPSVPSEDRYSVFKELCDDGQSLWNVTDTPASNAKDAKNTSTDVTDSGFHTTETWHNPLPDDDGDKDDEEDFGDFCHVQVVPPPAPTTPEKRTNMFGDLLYNPGPFSSQSNDTTSLGDGLSVNSLDFGARDSSLSSRHGSVLSLDFRLGNSDDDESASARTGCSDEARAAATADSQEEPSPSATSSVGEAACIDSWIRCVESVCELINEAESVFNREASSQVCREALDTAEGASYIQNLAEVYKVCQRIGLSSRLTGLQSESLDKLCCEVQETWERLASYLENSCLFTVKVPPAEDSKWLPSAEESAKSCGVCLLHVDNPDIASSKLSYSGREYHSPCANLWVNCVNSLLPAVTPVQLL